jgi:uncharacterized GH25 family protein
MLWLHIEDPKPNRADVTVEIGWGHAFPKNDVNLSEDRHDSLQSIRALDPEGNPIKLVAATLDRYSFKPTKQGIYQVMATLKAGFFSKTPDGFQFGTKKEVKDAVSCNHYDMRAKALIPVGKSKLVHDQHTDAPLEIVAMRSTGELKTGDILPVKVLLNNKALAGGEVQATYAGFSDDPDAFAVSEKTDDLGIANIKIKQPGLWIVTVRHKMPYADQQVCDNEVFRYSLTFMAGK